MSSTLRDLAGCLLKALHDVPSLHTNGQAAPKHLLCTAFTSNYATPEHCVMTETLPGTHYQSI